MAKQNTILTVKEDGSLVVPPQVVGTLALQPGEPVDVVNEGHQLRLTRPGLHLYAAWRDISHELLDD